LEEINDHLVATVGVVEVVERGGILLRRYEDTDCPLRVLAVHYDDTIVQWEDSAIGNGVGVTITEVRLVVFHKHAYGNGILKLEMSTGNRRKAQNCCNN